VRSDPLRRVAWASAAGLIGIVLASISPIAFAQSDERPKETAEDGAEITGAKTSNKPGFLFAPIPLSEPVFGPGLAVTGLVVYKLENSGPHASHTGVFAGATANGTWAAGITHSMKLNNDGIRIGGLLAYGHLNQKYFGLSGDLDPPIDYTQDSFLLEVEPRFRIKHSNWFAGFEYRFENTDTTINSEVPDGEQGAATPESREVRVGGLSALGAYDDRDNLYSATRGLLVEGQLGVFAPWLGGTTSFAKARLEYRHFVNWEKRLVVGWRVKSDWIEGEEAPFFELPYLGLRGYARGEIRDETVLSAEIEGRYDLFWRITGAVFGGLGWAADDYGKMFSSTTRLAGGFGLRYNLRPQDRLKIGIDMAWAVNGQPALYLRVGEAF